MTNQELNFRAMTRLTARYLADTRPTWEAAAPRLLSDYQHLVALLASYDQTAEQRTLVPVGGHAKAKRQALKAAVAAAMCVIKGLRAMQLSQSRLDLERPATLQLSDLKRLRDEALLTTLDGIRTASAPYATELAAENITADQLKSLDDTTAAYRALLGTPRANVLAGRLLRATTQDQLEQLRAALSPLDTRLDTLEASYPELVRGYRLARRIGQAGGGHTPKEDKPKDPKPKGK